MTDMPAQPERPEGVAPPQAGSRPRPPWQPPDLLTEELILLARQFSPDPARILTELLLGQRVRAALSKGVAVPPDKVSTPSRGALALTAAIERAALRCLADTEAAGSPNALPAGLEMSPVRVGADFQIGRTSPQEEIALEEAAVLLGLTRERVRQLVQEGAIEGWQDAAGRHEWHVSRASVVAYRERSGHGPGGSARRSA